MTQQIKLPPLPYPQMPGNDYTAADMHAYARAAVEAALQSQDRREWLNTLERKAEALWVATAEDRHQAMRDLVHHASVGPRSQDADMYWDADEPERFLATDLHEAVEYMMDGYTESDLPIELDLQRARSMPNIRVRVTAYSESGGYDYEVIDHARRSED